MPGTAALHDVHDRLQHHPPIVRIGSPCALGWRESRREPLPHHLEHRRRVSCWFRLTLWNRAGSTPSIVIIARPRLVPAPPPRPVQQGGRGALHGDAQRPKQAPNLGTAQLHGSPRWALKCAKLLVPVGSGRPLFGAIDAPVSARTTVRKACAHMARVICRYHPVQLRTS